MNRVTSASMVCLLRALKRNQFDREKVVVAARVRQASIEYCEYGRRVGNASAAGVDDAAHRVGSRGFATVSVSVSDLPSGE